MLKSLLLSCDRIYLDFKDDQSPPLFPISRNERLAREFKTEFPEKLVENLSQWLTGMRMIKSNIEIELIKSAGQITKGGYDRALNEFNLNVGFVRN